MRKNIPEDIDNANSEYFVDWGYGKDQVEPPDWLKKIIPDESDVDFWHGTGGGYGGT